MYMLKGMMRMMGKLLDYLDEGEVLLYKKMTCSIQEPGIGPSKSAIPNWGSCPKLSMTPEFQQYIMSQSPHSYLRIDTLLPSAPTGKRGARSRPAGTRGGWAGAGARAGWAGAGVRAGWAALGEVRPRDENEEGQQGQAE